MTITEQIDKIGRQLLSSGYKLTPQREATLRVLLENEKDHLNAEEVYLLVKASNPSIGLATVYRALELLSGLHIVEKINFGDGGARFDLRSEDQPHMHHHLICTRCGKVEEIMDDWLLPMERRLESELGFRVTDHRLDFHGICRDCRAAERESDGDSRAVS